MVNRYYVLATYDLKNMMDWVLDVCAKLGIDFAELAAPTELTDNFFVRMAGLYEFKHDVDVYALSSNATIDARRLHWLVRHRHSRDSATNLFYILTSLLEPLSIGAEADSDALAIEFDSSGGGSRVVHGIGAESPEGEAHTRVQHQRWGDPERLSVELNCPPGDPRPPELFDLVVFGTGVQADDFEVSAISFGRQEFLVRPDEKAIARYIKARVAIKARLVECHEKGLVRGTSW